MCINCVFYIRPNNNKDWKYEVYGDNVSTEIISYRAVMLAYFLLGSLMCLLLMSVSPSIYV